MKKILIAVSALLMLVGVSGAAGTDSFALTVVSQTNSTITFSYPAQSGYGYLYSANGAVVSRTYDPTVTQVKFSKNPQNSYEVAAIAKGATGSYTPAPPPPAAACADSLDNDADGLVDYPADPGCASATDTDEFNAPPPPPPPAGTISQNLPDGATISGVGTWSATYDANGDGQADDPGSVRFYVDGVQSFSDDTVPFSSSSWDSTAYVDGSHTMTVKALNGSGNVIAENSVTVTFSNGTTTPPPPPPPPPTGGTMTSAQCNSAAAVSGATIQNVTVTGDCAVSGSNVTFSNVTVKGILVVGDGTHVTGSTLLKFQAFGSDNWVIENSVLDGQGLVANNEIWDYPAGDTASGWTIRNNQIKNYYVASNPGTHSEGLYVGYSANGLIEGNTFTNNGNTGHIFFTWFGNTANPATSYPRNICVRGNAFYETHGAYVDINFRDEIPTSSGIKIQSDASTTSSQFYGTC